MVVAEVLTGIALVKQATDFIKSNISTAKDIGDIAGQIDNLFRGEQEAQKARNKKAGGSTEFVQAKEAEKNRRIEEARKQHEFWEAAKATAVAVIVVVLMVACFAAMLTYSR